MSRPNCVELSHNCEDGWYLYLREYLTAALASDSNYPLPHIALAMHQSLHFASLHVDNVGMLYSVFGVIQDLRNAVGSGRVSNFPENSVTNVYGSMLLALRGGGWVSIFQKKSVT